MQYFIKSIFIALQNIKANPLHTFLSTLGIIIGVAALVGILALGDGLEQTGREQLANTTSLNIINLNSRGTKTVNGVRVQIQDRPVFSIIQARELEEKYKDQAYVEFLDTRTAEIAYEDSVIGAYLQGNMENGLLFAPDSIAMGRYISAKDVQSSKPVAVLTYKAAESLSGLPESMIGKKILSEGIEYEVIGVFEKKETDIPKVFIPITNYLQKENQYPGITMKASKAEEIPEIELSLKSWLDEAFEEGSEAFIISTNRARIEQFSQGILLFKLIMGAITGISVLVGGIGVMNVLLISVTERTKEIGIRKATGAKKKDIVLQFMAESVTISFVGCVLGWILGIIGIFIFVPIVNAYTEIGQFQAAIGAGTVIAILVIALIIGVLFGTYPAWRAAQLTPVAAIRHE